MYKVGLKWPVIAMAVTRKPHSNSKPPFHKDCSPGPVKTPSNNLSMLSYGKERERERGGGGGTYVEIEHSVLSNLKQVKLELILSIVDVI